MQGIGVHCERQAEMEMRSLQVLYGGVKGIEEAAEVVGEPELYMVALDDHTPLVPEGQSLRVDCEHAQEYVWCLAQRQINQLNLREISMLLGAFRQPLCAHM